MASNLDLTAIGGFMTEKEAYDVLLREAKKLHDIAKRIWRETQKIEPEQYIRTYNAETALVVRKRKRKDGVNGIFLEVTWENHLAWHDSWLYKKGAIKKNMKGHAIILMSAGWHAKKLEKYYGKKVYKHTYYEGNAYLSRVIQAYSSVKDPRISLELEVASKLRKRDIK